MSTCRHRHARHLRALWPLCLPAVAIGLILGLMCLSGCQPPESIQVDNDATLGDTLILVTTPFAEMQVTGLLDGVPGIEIQRLTGNSQSGHFEEMSFGLIRTLEAAPILILTGAGLDDSLMTMVQRLSGAGAGTGTGEASVQRKVYHLFRPLGDGGGPVSHPWMNPVSAADATHDCASWLKENFPDSASRIDQNLEGLTRDLDAAVGEIRAKSAKLTINGGNGNGGEREEGVPAVLFVHSSVEPFISWVGLKILKPFPLHDNGQVTIAMAGKFSQLFSEGRVDLLIWDDQVRLAWLDSMAAKNGVPAVVILTMERKLPEGMTYPEVLLQNFSALERALDDIPRSVR